ncbi:DUF5667 domain-containing protein [Pseudonocardia acaciae]|uniref:DUF5667 domain-containing protein n=1 Tax=Pseudonocardia acaciae TaxID=551276 RepID=UPI00048E3BFD|nr:DUF5667 domain-containing protein [Pseudonocardia acaciae]
MPAGDGQGRERFAAALERGMAAVPPGDQELRRELELVALLKESRAALAPDADASARMRAKVMAAAATMLPQPEQDASTSSNDDEDATTVMDAPTVPGDATLIADAVEDDKPEDTNVVPIERGRGRHRFPRKARTASPSPHRRAQLTITAAAGVIVLAITGGGAMFSQDALPGDSLYGVKQATESALVGVTPGQGNKAQRQLDYAASRIDEVRQLNNGPTPTIDRGADISQALKGFNQQTADGSRMWLSSAGTNNSAELGALANWAQTQQQKLNSLRSTMPANAQPDADHSMRLLEDLRTRAQSLINRQGCDKVTSGDSDQLGPLPAKGSCTSKENTLAPIKSVAPSSPSKSSKSSEQSSGSSSSSSESSESSRGSSSEKSSKQKAPELPGLGGLTGGDKSGSGGIGPLPGRESTNGGDLLPTPSKEPQPGLNLQLPLLPILFQPIANGLNKRSDG